MQYNEYASLCSNSIAFSWRFLPRSVLLVLCPPPAEAESTCLHCLTHSCASSTLPSTVHGVAAGESIAASQPTALTAQSGCTAAGGPADVVVVSAVALLARCMYHHTASAMMMGTV